ncbi:MAG: hypothetical protein K6A32_07915 [Bacteroidales bacterium]|nr:hypothetical protein [Bacteroidales bacterium]
MRRHLLWISLCLCLCSPIVRAQVTYPLLLSGEERATWNFTLERGTMVITGICLARQTEQGLVGSVVNEFGIHFFDFTCTDDRVKVSNVFSAMDKWYIRRVLKKDLRLLAASKAYKTGRRRSLSLALPDSMSLQNNKYGITYRFERLQQ